MNVILNAINFTGRRSCLSLLNIMACTASIPEMSAKQAMYSGWEAYPIDELMGFRKANTHSQKANTTPPTIFSAVE